MWSQQFSGTLSERDCQQHIPHQFDVPAGLTALIIDYEYAPAEIDGFKNLCTLSVYAPDGCRGAAHRDPKKQHIVISSGDSTPGFTSGAITAGRWQIDIDSHMVLPGEPLRYTLTISGSSDPQSAAPTWTSSITASRGAGWYRGNLHSHTFHSDASMSAADLVRWARSENFDFVALTDHNTISGLAQMDSLGAADLLVMGGIELTTFYGHALVMGVRDWIDWRVRADRNMLDIQREAEARGATFIIAHPFTPGGKYCTGCHWEYSEMMPGTARLLEIWNWTWDGDSNNQDAVELWYSWLNQGYRIFATAGNDIHDVPTEPLRLGFNVVYAQELSEREILAAIRKGHNYLSSAPQLNFEGRTLGGQTILLGEQLPAGTLHLDWSNCGDSDLGKLIVNGQQAAVFAAKSAGSLHWTPQPDWKWAVVEIRDDQGNLKAITNPIFIG
ncbi:MAG: CehA/McbA family metallohydrolase [Anaerolineae bacterium]